jgi:hypothetical protein
MGAFRDKTQEKISKKYIKKLKMGLIILQRCSIIGQ